MTDVYLIPICRRITGTVGLLVMLAAASMYIAPTAAAAAPSRCSGVLQPTPNTIAAGNVAVEKASTTTCDSAYDYYYRLTDTANDGVCVRAVHADPGGGHTACTFVDVVYYGDNLSTIKVCTIAPSGALGSCSGTFVNWGY